MQIILEIIFRELLCYVIEDSIVGLRNHRIDTPSLT